MFRAQTGSAIRQALLLWEFRDTSLLSLIGDWQSFPTDFGNGSWWVPQWPCLHWIVGSDLTWCLNWFVVQRSLTSTSMLLTWAFPILDKIPQVHICYRLREAISNHCCCPDWGFLNIQQLSNFINFEAISRSLYFLSCCSRITFSIASFNHFISGFVDFAISTPCNFVPSLAKWSACWSPSRSLCSVTQQFLFWIHDSASPPLITAFDLIALESSISNATCHSRCKL